MQEITTGIYIETGCIGATLGAINTVHGLILIDAPVRLEDARSWRSALLNLGGGVDRLLINLDAHPDRTLGTRNMECTVVGHEHMAEVFKNRPNTFKAQYSDTGADWEQISNIGTIRWNPPEISFTGSMTIHWGTKDILLESRPGPSAGSIWVRLPQDQVIFIGDHVLYDQPPFLAFAMLNEWINNLELLASPEFNGYIMIGGHNGIVTPAHVRQQIDYLKKVQELCGQIKKNSDLTGQIDRIITELPESGRSDSDPRYRQRLHYGLTQLYNRSSRSAAAHPEE